MAKLPTINIELEDLGEKLDIDHIRDLLQAEQDGRLVVIPCKVGDTVYVIGESCDFCETYLDEPERCMRCEKGHYAEERGFELWMLSELNESIFLTREEAEAALAQITTALGTLIDKWAMISGGPSDNGKEDELSKSLREMAEELESDG